METDWGGPDTHGYLHLHLEQGKQKFPRDDGVNV